MIPVFSTELGQRVESGSDGELKSIRVNAGRKETSIVYCMVVLGPMSFITNWPACCQGPAPERMDVWSDIPQIIYIYLCITVIMQDAKPQCDSNFSIPGAGILANLQNAMRVLATLVLGGANYFPRNRREAAA